MKIEISDSENIWFGTLIIVVLIFAFYYKMNINYESGDPLISLMIIILFYFNVKALSEYEEKKK